MTTDGYRVGRERASTVLKRVSQRHTIARGLIDALSTRATRWRLASIRAPSARLGASCSRSGA